jgi:hypothetical protein
MSPTICPSASQYLSTIRLNDLQQVIGLGERLRLRHRKRGLEVFSIPVRKALQKVETAGDLLDSPGETS